VNLDVGMMIGIFARRAPSALTNRIASGKSWKVNCFLIALPSSAQPSRPLRLFGDLFGFEERHDVWGDVTSA
jgi:hypothetical protein